jgi:hypothetical protein
MKITAMIITLLFAAVARGAGDTLWKIDGNQTSGPKSPNDASKTPSSAVKNNESQPANYSTTSYASFAKVPTLERPSDEDTAKAFGVDLGRGFAKTLPQGDVRIHSLSEILGPQYAAIANALPVYSKCGGKNLVTASSSMSDAEGRLVYGMRSTCDGTCLVTAERTDEHGKLLKASEEYRVASSFCQVVFGGMK